MPIAEQRSGSFGLTPRLTEPMLQSIEQAEQDAKKAWNDQQKEEIISLAAHVKKAWEAARSAKESTGIEKTLLQSLRQFTGDYDPDILARIRGDTPGGSETYMMLTNIKSRAAESWIRDIILPPGDKPWSLSPTPVAQLSDDKEAEIYELVNEETVQMMMAKGIESVDDEHLRDRLNEVRENVQKEAQDKAKKAAARLETHINDQLTEGHYYAEMAKVIKDLSIFPACFFKGPVVRRKSRLVWTNDPNGELVPAVERVPVKEYYRVSPFDIYLSPGSKNIQDGYLCERHRLRRSDLVAMRGVQGFKDAAIDAVLLEHGSGGLGQWLAVDQSRADIENRPQETSDPDPPIDCIEFWGSAQGKKLLEWGMPKKVIRDPGADYKINAWLIGQWVIMARLNPHPLGRRPYYSASYSGNNDSIWGLGPPQLMRDTQGICNSSARSLVNNLALASGPMGEIQTDRLDPMENPENVHPWKFWKTKSDIRGGHSPAVNFFQVDPMSGVLTEVYDYFFRQASEQTGIPNYVYGSGEIEGAGDTASGLSMLMNAAGKTLKGVVSHIDENIIKPSIYEHWMNVMLYDKDVDKSGDINIIARASEHLIMAEQLQIRRSEALDRTNNEWDRSIIGDKGRATMLRDSFDSMKMDVDEIVPSKEEMEMREQALLEMQQQEMQQNQGAQQGAQQTQQTQAETVDEAGGAKGKEPGRTMGAQ